MSGTNGQGPGSVISEEALRQLRATVRGGAEGGAPSQGPMVGAMSRPAGVAAAQEGAGGPAGTETPAGPPPPFPSAPPGDDLAPAAVPQPATPSLQAEAPSAPPASPLSAAAPPPVAAAPAPEAAAPVDAPAPPHVAALPTSPAPPPVGEAPPAPARAQPAAVAAPEATAPSTALSASAEPGREDEGLPLRIELRNADAGTRILVTGLPEGARLSAGTPNPDGSWTLTAGETRGLTFLPAPHWSGEARLGLRIASPDASALPGEAATTLIVRLEAVADVPLAGGRDVSGGEDRAVALDLSAGLVDLDGSEKLTVALLGLPDGAVLSAGTRGADGAWTVPVAALPGLMLTPPPDFAGTLALTLRATATEARGASAATERAFEVRVATVADGAALAGAGAGREDSAIPISASFGTPADASEAWDAVALIRGVPADAALSQGTNLGGGTWQVDRAELAAGRVAITPPADSDAAIALVIEARVTDREGAGASRLVSAEVTVAVQAVADAPDAHAADVAGSEDAAVALDLSAALRDLDGSEALEVLILGLPEGATLSAGARGADGAWALAPADLPGLTLTPPPDFAGTLALTLRATATEARGGRAATERTFTVEVAPRVEAAANLSARGEGDEDRWITVEARLATLDGSERLSDATRISGVPAGAVLNGGTEMAPGTWSVPTADLLAGRIAIRPPADSDADLRLTVSATLVDRAGAASDSRVLEAVAEIRVAAVADVPLAGGRDVSGGEDRAVALDLSAGLVDLDGSEKLTVALLGLPDGAVLSAGTRGADGAWTVPVAALPGLMLTPPPDFAGEIALVLRATAAEGANGDRAVREVPFRVLVAAEVDGASLSATASGREDEAIPLQALFGTSPDASEAWDTVAVIRGVPAGATLSQGTDLGGGAWQVSREELAAGRVAITPPANSDAALALTVEAWLLDREGGGAQRLVTAPLQVAVQAVADAPQARAADVSGEEDRAVALDLSAGLVDLDGSETLTVALLGLPDGAVLSAGTRGADGAWTVPAASLPGLMLTPPPDFAGTLALTLRAIATEARGASAATERAFEVTVAPRADAAQVAAAGEGAEDSWIAVRGTLATTDRDGSESLGDTLTVSGVPAGAVLNGGTEVAPGTWEVPRSLFEAGSLAIRPPADSDADIALRIGVRTLDGASAAVTEAVATVLVRAVADAPSVQVADAHGREDEPIRLAGLGGALADTDGSETLHFVLSGVPASATLSAGTRGADGTWTLTPAQLATVSITPPAHFSGSMNLVLAAVATEAQDGAAPARATAPFRVSVDPVADAGTIAGSVTGNEDTLIQVRPTFATPDADGSETWSATTRVAGVPAGATLTRGTEVAPGEWEVSTAELRAGQVSVRPPANSDVDFTLTLRATLTDTGNGMSVSRDVSGTHRVTVRAVADAPEVTVADVAGAEDQAIPLNLTAQLADRDGSEVLSLVMSGVPAGATLSAGTRNANGTWTVAPADLPSLQVTPPRDFSGTMNLTLRATARDNDNSTATTSRSFAVRVEAVADAPSLRVGPVAGREDEAIGLRVSAATTDVDGSERIAGFRLLDVPEGAVVRAGGAVIARQADGSVLVDAAAAPTLSVTPPPDSDRDFTLRVTAISEEPNGSRAESAPRDLPVRVDAVADAPVWIRLGAAGEEDGVIPLGLSARLPDADGSEALSFVVSGLPAGAVLSHGTYRGPGSWSLTAAEAALATLTPPRDFAGTLNLTATAVAQEADGGHQATTTVTFPVHVTAVVDTADWAATARGAEDEPIALRLAPPLRDADGSERLVGDVLVEGVPEGAVLRLADGSAVAVSGGACAIPVAQLAGLTILMPGDSDVAARLHVTVTVEDAGGVRALVRGEVTVDPLGVADMPALRVTDVTMTGHASGQPSEGWAALPIAAAVTDTDGSETAHVWVRDVPEGFRLSAGTPAGSGAWLLREADLPGLSIRPPAGYEGEVVLRVTAVAVEREGDTEQASATLTFRVEPPAGGGGGGGGTGGSSDGGGILPGDPPPAPPTLSVTDGSGWEDGSAPLPVAAAAAPGTALGLLVHGVPAGARLSAGIHDAERDVWVLRPEELDGLRVIPAPDFAGEVALRITAIAVGATGATASDEAAATLRIEAVADGPALSAAPDAGVEDREVPLNLAIAAADVDGSERVVAITLSGLPRGATIAPAPGVRDNGDGTWSVDPAAAGLARLVPPPDAHGTFSLTVTATTEEASNGAQATASRGITVAVAPAPDAPVAAAADAAGQEDRPIALALSAALADADGSEALSVVVSGLPEGARLSAGINNGDGSWTLTPGQLAGLTVTPPQDWSGSMALTMRAHAMERSTGEVATTEVAFRVAVAGVADAPLVDAAATAAGAEDAPIGLDILARLTDTDGSEQLVLLVTGVPAGAAFSAGSANADGSWTIPGAALPGLTFTPPRDYAGTLRLEFAATAQEAEGGSAATRFQIAVTVDPVADAPTLSLAAVQGAEDSWIRLPIAATLTDTDGSEGLARFLVSGLPAGATLSHGTAGAGGVWTLTPAQAAVVSMRPSANWSGTADLSVTAISREAANGSEAGTTARLSVTVTPVADAPILTLSAAQGAEDTAIRLPIAATLTDTDGSEGIARFLVSGLPAGATLSQGTADAGGVWTLTPAQAAVVTMTPPANWSGTASLSVTAVSREAANGAEASSTLILPVTIAAVADAPVLAAADASGLEDQSVALSLSAALGDLDGSERFAAIQVTGLPPGFALSAGTPLGDGAWALALSDFDGLRLTAPADWNGTLSLALVATAQDGTSTATASRTFSVTLAPVNDAPSVALFGAPGAATGQDRVALLEGATIADVDSPRMGGATITLAGAQPGDRLVFDGEPLREEGGRTLLGDTGIEVAAAPDGTVTLSGPAPAATYARVLETLVLESPDGLAAGTRTIGVTLRDEAGAAAPTQVVGLTVDPSVIMGGESGGILAGTAGHDTFIGGTGDETMQGGAGADLFVVAMDGSADQIDGGAGSWTDTVKVQGAGAPGQGGWTLVIEGDTAMTALDRSFDFAQPVSGHIQFADGTQVDLMQIERISW